jgi:voltage-gated potassium channel Kch
VVRNSIALIIIFAAIYYFFQPQIKLPMGESNMSIWDSVYYSTVTFTTLGYGDFVPIGQLRLVAAIEAVLGGVSLGFLVGGFSNFKY